MKTKDFITYRINDADTLCRFELGGGDYIDVSFCGNGIIVRSSGLSVKDMAIFPEVANQIEVRLMPRGRS
jgi:hypothetical protein